MSPDAPPVALDDLLAHRRWVRALARSLISDVNDADDVEQQVWIAAVERPPRRPGNLRAWLARVVRRRRADLARREGRRMERESRASRDSAVPGPDELVCRAETQARVVRAVLALGEPYRTTILLRFFQGMPAREIAAYQAVPLETVRTRLGRALAQLRERLAHELGGDDHDWRRALLPVAGIEGARTTTDAAGFLTPAAPVKGGAVAAGLLAVLLGAALLAHEMLAPPAVPSESEPTTAERAARPARTATTEPWLRGSPRRARHAVTAAETLLDEGARADGGWPQPTALRVVDADEAVPPSDAPGAGRTATPAGGLAISGRVVEEGTDLPIPGLLLEAVEGAGGAGRPPVRAFSAEDGAFALCGLTAGSWTLTAGRRGATAEAPADEFVASRWGPVEAGTSDLRIELRRGFVIEGVVYGPDGEPWSAGASLRVMPVARGEAVDYAGQHRARVAADGTFRLAGLARGRYDLTVAPACGPGVPAGCGLVHLPGVAAGTTGLVVNLIAGRALEGRLVDERGEGVKGRGWVWVSPSGTPVSSPGSVSAMLLEDGRFRTTPLDPGLAYDVAASGFAGYGHGTLRGVKAGDEVVVVVLSRGLEISGSVVDADGRPAPSGVPVMAVADDRTWDSPSRPAWAYAYGRTDAGGRFTLSGLASVPYTVRTGGSTSGYLGIEVRCGVVAPAEGLTLRVERGVPFRGRLVDACGNGVPFATLFVHDAEGRSQTPLTRTRQDGSFDFAGVHRGTIRIVALLRTSHVPIGTFEAPADDLTLTLPE